MNLTANIILNGEKLKAFPLRSGTREGCPLSPLLFNIVLEVLAMTIRRKRNKRNPDWKRSKTLTVCWWHDTVHRKPKRQYQKVAEYKINTQKSLAFLYTNNEKSEREIKESIPFTIAITRTKNI